MYERKSLRKVTKRPKKRGPKKKRKNTAVIKRMTMEDILEAEKQRREHLAIGHKSNGDNLYLVRIQKDELKIAGYRLAVGGDSSVNFWAVRDDQGFFTLDGKCVFCLKGNVGRKKLMELIDKGFFDSDRLQHKDKL